MSQYSASYDDQNRPDWTQAQARFAQRFASDEVLAFANPPLLYIF